MRQCKSLSRVILAPGFNIRYFLSTYGALHTNPSIDKSSICMHGPLKTKSVGWRLKPHSSIGVLKCYGSKLRLATTSPRHMSSSSTENSQLIKAFGLYALIFYIVVGMYRNGLQHVNYNKMSVVCMALKSPSIVFFLIEGHIFAYSWPGAITSNFQTNYITEQKTVTHLQPKSSNLLKHNNYDRAQEVHIFMRMTFISKFRF